MDSDGRHRLAGTVRGSERNVRNRCRAVCAPRVAEPGHHHVELTDNIGRLDVDTVLERHRFRGVGVFKKREIVAAIQRRLRRGANAPARGRAGQHDVGGFEFGRRLFQRRTLE